MSDTNLDSSKVTSNWDAYWQGTGDAGAFSAGGVSHPAIQAFWEAFFHEAKIAYTRPAMVDIASGNGAVVERAFELIGEGEFEITCVDASSAAVANIEERFPGVKGLIADVRSIPLDSGRYDIVTSQFGVEYAGIDAIDEAARLLAGGGSLAMLLHHQASSIHEECVASLDAIERLRDSRFLPLAIEMFRAGFDAVSGADRAPYDEAAMQLSPAVQALEAIMEQHGQHVASDNIARLYSDVGRIHSRIQHYDPGDVLQWLDRMEGELEAYAGRMSSMRDCAIDELAFDRLCMDLRSKGLTIEEAGPFMAPQEQLPLAWALLVSRQPNSGG